MSLQFNVTKVQGRNVITAFIDGQLKTAGEDNPNFQQILSQCLAGDDAGLLDLFDPAKLVAETFEKISDRVSLKGGVLFLDGDPVDNSLSRQVKRFMDEGRSPSEWAYLVNYFERVQQNPQEDSREQLFDWVAAHDVTITADGLLKAYKGVSRRSDGLSPWESGFSGTAIVNGEVFTGRIPYDIGDEVEMPRSEVTHDPAAACSAGLHVGTFAYAQSYAQAAMLEVLVDPRDVVSVPHDGGGAKIRVCRFTILDVTEKEDTRALADDVDLYGYEYDDEYDDEYAGL